VLRQVDDAINKLGKNISDTSITCLGLSFKADIDDLRESPALDIAISLGEYQVKNLFIVEPNISSLPEKLKRTSTLVDFKIGIEKADIVVVLVDHKEFKTYKRKQISQKYIIDTRGLYTIHE
jgi:UDP-N-acetyl-D-mannosaminuronic acid dehydrogenase